MRTRSTSAITNVADVEPVRGRDGDGGDDEARRTPAPRPGRTGSRSGSARPRPGSGRGARASRPPRFASARRSTRSLRSAPCTRTAATPADGRASRSPRARCSCVAMSTLATISSLRRSTASASEPPRNEHTMTGPSCARLSRPTCSDEFVSRKICSADATIVSWRPKNDTSCPVKSSRYWRDSVMGETSRRTLRRLAAPSASTSAPSRWSRRPRGPRGRPSG